MSRLVLAGLAMIAPAALATVAAAQPVAEFYKGRTISIIVGAGEGSGFDMYARALARQLPRHLAGSPGVVVQNRPGAGGINAANYLFNVAPQDGTVIATISGSAPVLQLMGEPGPQFDSMKFQWLGNLVSDTSAFVVWHTSKVKTFDDAFRHEAVLGSFGPNVSEIFPALSNNLLGTRFRVIQGYKSGPTVRLAMESGEVEGTAQTWAAVQAAHPQWIAEGKINVLAQIALKPDPGLTRMKVPLLTDFVTRERVLPQYSVEHARAYFKLMLIGDELARPYVAGPGVPKDRVEALSKAFAETAKDPAFLAEMSKAGRPVDPIGGAEIEKLLHEVAATPKEVIGRAKELIKYQAPAK